MGDLVGDGPTGRGGGPGPVGDSQLPYQGVQFTALLAQICEDGDGCVDGGRIGHGALPFSA